MREPLIPVSEDIKIAWLVIKLRRAHRYNTPTLELQKELNNFRKYYNWPKYKKKSLNEWKKILWHRNDVEELWTTGELNEVCDLVI